MGGSLIFAVFQISAPLLWLVYPFDRPFKQFGAAPIFRSSLDWRPGLPCSTVCERKPWKDRFAGPTSKVCGIEGFDTGPRECNHTVMSSDQGETPASLTALLWEVSCSSQLAQEKQLATDPLKSSRELPIRNIWGIIRGGLVSLRFPFSGSQGGPHMGKDLNNFSHHHVGQIKIPRHSTRAIPSWSRRAAVC